MSSKCPECEEGLPEWIMSYADMITILMAFFVVMYSMAGEKDPKKEEAVMNSLRIWLGGINAPWPDLHSGASTRSDKTPKGPRASATTVGNYHRSPSTAGSTIYCSAGDAGLSDENREHLRLASESLLGKRHLVEIRGRPSRRPLPADSPFHDPLEMTYAKCRLARDFLIAQGVEPERIQLLLVTSAAPEAREDAQLLTQDARLEVLLLGLFLDPPKSAHRPAASADEPP
jgi:MotA/MotB-like proton-channel complex protein